jgi:hypothetical protein
MAKLDFLFHGRLGLRNRMKYLNGDRGLLKYLVQQILRHHRAGECRCLELRVFTVMDSVA